MKIDAVLAITYVSYRTSQEEVMTPETGYLVLGGIVFAALGTVTIAATLRSARARKIARNLEGVNRELSEEIDAAKRQLTEFIEKLEELKGELSEREKQREGSKWKVLGVGEYDHVEFLQGYIGLDRNGHRLERRTRTILYLKDGQTYPLPGLWDIPTTRGTLIKVMRRAEEDKYKILHADNTPLGPKSENPE